MSDYFDVLEGLSSEQKAACTTPGNILLTACPGSGKTRTLTHRLAHLVALESSSRKRNIAITYTNRAAEEINSRLANMGIDLSNIWTGTIHQFCMQFVIRPYSMYSSRLSKGYSIIDEYTRDSYGRAIAKNLGITLNYYDDPFKYPVVVQKYETLLDENQEIDFEMILRFSEELLSQHSFICTNIALVTNMCLANEKLCKRARDEQSVNSALICRFLLLAS